MVNKEDLLTVEMVREFLDCDVSTGKMIWKVRDVKWFAATGHGGAQGACNRWNAKKAGKVASHLMKSSGYHRVCIFDIQYLAHRVIWFWHYGEWPKNQIDHLDGNRANNAIDNLADKTAAENQRNKKNNSRNKSGFPGVHFNNREEKWRAKINIDRKPVHLGSFDSPEEAYAVWLERAKASGYTRRHITKEKK